MIEFCAKSRALTFLYGCGKIILRNVKLKLNNKTEELNEIEPFLHTLKMIDVHESCPFTELSLSLPTMKKLYLINSQLEIFKYFDSMSHMRELSFINTSFI